MARRNNKKDREDKPDLWDAIEEQPNEEPTDLRGYSPEPDCKDDAEDDAEDEDPNQDAASPNKEKPAQRAVFPPSSSEVRQLIQEVAGQSPPAPEAPEASDDPEVAKTRETAYIQQLGGHAREMHRRAETNAAGYVVYAYKAGIAIGKLKKLVTHGNSAESNGGWEQFVETELKMRPRTARKYRQYAERLHQFQDGRDPWRKHTMSLVLRNARDVADPDTEGWIEPAPKSGTFLHENERTALKGKLKNTLDRLKTMGKPFDRHLSDLEKAEVHSPEWVKDTITEDLALLYEAVAMWQEFAGKMKDLQASAIRSCQEGNAWEERSGESPIADNGQDQKASSDNSDADGHKPPTGSTPPESEDRKPDAPSGVDEEEQRGQEAA